MRPGRKYTNYVAKTAGRNKLAVPKYSCTLRLTKAEQRLLEEWAVHFDLSISALVMKSVTRVVAWQRKQLNVQPDYFYVRLPDGILHPPAHEQGYEFETNAQRYAWRVGGTVVKQPITAQPPAANQDPDRTGVAAGEHGGESQR